MPPRVILPGGGREKDELTKFMEMSWVDGSGEWRMRSAEEMRECDQGHV